ncbi:phosphoserine phosphatase, chloroplastic [Tanacetum coccineum]
MNERWVANNQTFEELLKAIKEVTLMVRNLSATVDGSLQVMKEPVTEAPCYDDLGRLYSTKSGVAREKKKIVEETTFHETKKDLGQKRIHDSSETAMVLGSQGKSNEIGYFNGPIVQNISDNREKSEKIVTDEHIRGMKLVEFLEDKTDCKQPGLVSYSVLFNVFFQEEHGILESRGSRFYRNTLRTRFLTYGKSVLSCFDVDKEPYALMRAIDELAEFVGSRESCCDWTDRLSPGIHELVQKLKESGKTVYLISGGFRQMINRCLHQSLSFQLGKLFDNQLLFGYFGGFAGFDANEPTSRSGGKPTAVELLRKTHGYKTVVMIGDGATDLEAKEATQTALDDEIQLILEVLDRLKFVSWKVLK